MEGDTDETVRVDVLLKHVPPELSEAEMQLEPCGRSWRWTRRHGHWSGHQEHQLEILQAKAGAKSPEERAMDETTGKNTGKSRRKNKTDVELYTTPTLTNRFEECACVPQSWVTNVRNVEGAQLLKLLDLCGKTATVENCGCDSDGWYG